ncbi:alpha-amylase family glycosyl hydrolase [Flavihumibacter rivuli]|uniref:alpha-amylase family glycosyl hydrolase n=1 Tax=Flavihumibacter rivuli TaxID=2838156 RepID=UPI001BDE3FB8|nr:alpha-amylase family glycosyl hydrolase [Flavihumibacter rivuli]ULQ55873.1 alpha-amylase family glycosyl hydrolase [Flavihumibacter rivuli]
MRILSSLAIALLWCCFLSPAHAQSFSCYPTNWWVGMTTNRVQLMIRNTGASIDIQKVSLQYPGVRVEKLHRTPNPHYLLLDLVIEPGAKAGNVPITLNSKGKSLTIQWPLHNRRGGNGKDYARGVGSEDFISLLITDRFANGDPANDRIPGMRDQSLNRDSIYHRHGGDFQGIINHLDYFRSLGVTALWLLPVQENNMPNRTEHGYAITDHYTIDPRFGGEAGYLKLGDSLRKHNMKLILDAVYNHMGLYHFLAQDPPAPDWLHQWPAFTQTNSREQTLFDPYAAPSEHKKMVNGWFVKEMPDFNHSNPFMATFLTQHLIWYVEKFGVDAIRVDTYTYNDPVFSNACNEQLLREFPRLTLFGESKVNGVLNQAYYTQNNLDLPFKSNMPGTLDFQCLQNGIIPALMEPVGWMSGVYKLYNTLSQDMVYKNPMNNVLLLDSHDDNRFFSEVKEDVRKHEIAFQWLLTCRGIPQMYYGSEVLMKGLNNPDGWLRQDFPGGWEGDKKNAFTGEGLNADERRVQQLVQQLGRYRLGSSALKKGKMMHYVPENGVYAYFRYDDNQTVMCIMNTSEHKQAIDFRKYTERVNGFQQATNVITNEKLALDQAAEIPAMKMWVLELSR